MFDKYGIVAYTPEVGPNDAEAKSNGRNNYDAQDSYGFWPTPDRIPTHSNKSVAANALAWLSGPCYKPSLDGCKWQQRVVVMVLLSFCLLV